MILVQHFLKNKPKNMLQLFTERKRNEYRILFKTK